MSPQKAARDKLKERNLMHPEERPELKKATTITSRTIKNAYVFGDRKSQRRIEAYGRLSADIFNELIVHEPNPAKKT